MLLAALAAEGSSTIHNVGQIERGYERIDERLRALGRRSSGWMGSGERSAALETVAHASRRSIAKRSSATPVPRFEIPDWRDGLGVVAGITGRGAEPGRGFDLGLWSDAPVGEVMSRWRAFRRALPEFDAVALGNQVHGVEVRARRRPGVDPGRGDRRLGHHRPRHSLDRDYCRLHSGLSVVPGRGVALLHAGWRGTAGGSSAGVERLRRRLGAQWMIS